MNLRQYMRIRNITVREMAKLLGVSSGTINNMFNGRDPRLSLAMKIQEVTDGEVSCEDLLSRSSHRDEDGDDEEE